MGFPYDLLLNSIPPLEVVCYQIDNRARADILSLFSINGYPGVLAIQCKVKQALDFEDAVFSVTSGCQYFTTDKYLTSSYINNRSYSELETKQTYTGLMRRSI